MYDYITGKICTSTPEGLVIEANGIGYRLFTTAVTACEAIELPSPVKLYVSFVIREYSQTFYGFLTKEERDLFESLLNISGIGPKIALSMIGHAAPQELASAVQRKDISALCKIPGIGKKTAERLLVELKDHMASFHLSAAAPQNSQTTRDAVSALLNLGYNQFSAQKAVKKAIERNGEIEDLPYLISLSLKEID